MFYKILSSRHNKLSFLDEEEDSGVIISKKAKRKGSFLIHIAITEEGKESTKPKLSLFSNKRVKKTSDPTESSTDINNLIEKKKFKNFGKDPLVNTSFLKDEDKLIEDEIRKKAERNKVRHSDFIHRRYWKLWRKDSSWSNSDTRISTAAGLREALSLRKEIQSEISSRSDLRDSLKPMKHLREQLLIRL